ncbi:MAG: hypothetical protein GY798_28400 [Hyphomicrobiales bacterium]|nr:hypothetical protein [Hyphomicrobiales bacterium]
MKTSVLIPTIGVATALLAITSLGSAADVTTQTVMTHPSQGEVTAVNGAAARLTATDEGMFVGLDTKGLTAGNVHTLWLVVINEPTACETEKCTSRDVLKRSDEVRSDVGYAGGIIVGEDGTGSFAWYQQAGELDGPWFGYGLNDPTSAEVHLVINDHGPAIEGRVADMLSTYRDGCMDESIPGPMPATARAQGEPGPNQCRLVQFTVFKNQAKGS